MERTKLDRTRPFGQVYGHPHVQYEQDHKLFDAQGVEVVSAPRAEEASPGNGADAPHTLDEGHYKGWKIPKLRAEIGKRTGTKPPTGTEREKLVSTLLALDQVGIVGDRVNAEADDASFDDAIDLRGASA